MPSGTKRSTFASRYLPSVPSIRHDVSAASVELLEGRQLLSGVAAAFVGPQQPDRVGIPVATLPGPVALAPARPVSTPVGELDEADIDQPKAFVPAERDGTEGAMSEPGDPNSAPYQAALGTQTYAGPLAGKIVYTSPGHGWQWSDTLGRWATDRGDSNEIVEDFGNQDQVTYYADYILRAGGTVVPMRPVGHQLNEVVVDNDSPGVTFSGNWTATASSRYYDEDYGAGADPVGFQFASISANETAVATYTPTIPETGYYPVYTWALPGANRTNQLYRINHTGGVTEVRVDHRKVGGGWVYLGTYFFAAGASQAAGSVQISNASSAGGSVVIADAIRFGNGMGDLKDGPGGVGAASGTISGYSREDEDSMMWLWRAVGQGTSASTVVGTSNVSAPARMAEWMNSDSNVFGTSIYLGFHSNAGGGRGARGLYDTVVAQRTPNAVAWATLTGQAVNSDMQALTGVYGANWTTGTTAVFAGSFGEINVGDFVNAAGVTEMDATIIEVAFHDDATDALLLRTPGARDQIARASFKATLQYFQTYGGLSTPVLAPAAPVNPRASASAAGDITVAWSAGGTGVRGGAATGYRVYLSSDGYGFGNAIDVAAGTTSLTMPAAQLGGDAIYFRVTAINAGGESPWSATAGARRNGTGGGGGANRILVVNGFDRADSTNNARQPYDGQAVDRVWPRLSNSMDYVVQVGEALERYSAGGTALGFDFAQNDQLISGAVNLAQYQTVIWLAGEESTVDETFSAAEEGLVTGYLAGGGKLFVSGSEIGWDLDRASGPTTADRSFYNDVLKTDYVSDDAGTYTVAPVTAGIFAGLGSLSFNSGTTIYDAEYPDVIASSGGSTAALTYSGGLGGTAAVQWSAGPATTAARVVSFGFPFETLASAAGRASVLGRVLDFFQTSVPIDLIAPSIVGVSVNNGSAQRSRVTTVTYTFSEPVTLVAGAFQASRLSDGLLAGITPVDVSGNGTVWELRFTGSGSQFGSLAEGRWTFTVDSSKVRDLAGNPLTAAAAVAVKRFYGDADGDGDVDASDLAYAAPAVNSFSSESRYRAELDLNGDGFFEEKEEAEIRVRLGTDVK